MPVGALLVFIAAVVVTAVLLPVVFLVVDILGRALIAGSGLYRDEQRILRLVVDSLATALACVPAWFIWRHVRRLPKRVAITCPACSWTGTGRLTEWDPLNIAKDPEDALPVEDSQVEVEIKGIPNPPNTVEQRMERLAKRRRKQAREAESENPPNPDFDFGDE
jgi:hypothetical protein